MRGGSRAAGAGGRAVDAPGRDSGARMAQPDAHGAAEGGKRAAPQHMHTTQRRAARIACGAPDVPLAALAMVWLPSRDA